MYIVLIKSGVSDKQTTFFPGDILRQNDNRAGRHYPSAIFEAGAQRDARVLHCKNPVHSPGAPRRLKGYPGCYTRDWLSLVYKLNLDDDEYDDDDDDDDVNGWV